VKSLYRGADILILDEPTAVLTPQEIEDLLDLMEELADAGHSLIFITHKLGKRSAQPMRSPCCETARPSVQSTPVRPRKRN